ncbi:MAG: LD-carboxypeptidase [Acidipropionibacterium sp.]|jgi:muramoyltetrapeptide carboxypeptidase|nr:LD-carboxypeptidase [Acidipropionibacterium sp.]
MTPSIPDPTAEPAPGTCAAGLVDGLRDSYLDTAPLSPGDVVGLVGPSGPSTEQSVERAVGYLEGWGLRVRVGAHILARDSRADYLAGSDDRRRADLVDAWTDPEVDAVVCVRGGYGAMRLIDGIDWDAMAASTARRDGRPKLLTGSSDITALHEAFRFHLGVAGLFCPMPGNDVFRDSAAIRADVARWLLEPWRGRTIAGPGAEVLVPGSAAGVLRGGNLSLLAAGIGAPEAGARAGERPGDPPEILLLEDVDEELYRLDNLMIQMARSGRLGSAAAVLLGSWHDCAEPDRVRALMSEYLSGLGVPVAWELGFGHDPNALSVPLNVGVALELPRSGSPELRVG